MSDTGDTQEDIEALKAEIAKMEAEAAEHEAAEAAANPGVTPVTVVDDGVKKDGNSVYVGQVEYTCTPEDLVTHFKSCGKVERVTIMCDKISGKPKGE